ncbi:dihydroorotase [Trueperella pyogenes]|uniref:dihydroorotase n=1 Tax=Trueperella pyogenes TaxID=1661 RepID=UPI0014331A5C|nr:dihydroorotase [Trueperella pyogenes]QIU87414.1 dihydroorotase [Trueperella pyogenes]
MRPDLKAEIRVYRQIEEIATLLDLEIISPATALSAAELINTEGAPLAAHKRACFVDYLEALSDVWIQAKTASD